jgi:glycosyltransferase 2 family protein
LKLKLFLRFNILKPSSLKNIAIIAAKISFILFAFYWVFNKIDFSKFTEVLKHVNVLPLLLSYGCLHISLLFSSMRSRYYFSTFGLKLRRTFSVALYYIGMMFNIVLPGGISGDGYKIYYLNKLTTFSKLTALRIMFYERVSGFYVLTLFGLLLLPFTDFWKLIPYGFELSILVLTLVTPCYFLGAHYIIKDKFKTALIASFYSFGVQTLQVISAALLVYAIFPSAEINVYIDYIFLFIVGSILAIIPISIGGAGLRELSMLYGLQLINNGTTIEMGIAFASISFALYVATALTGLPILYKLKSIHALKLS